MVFLSGQVHICFCLGVMEVDVRGVYGSDFWLARFHFITRFLCESSSLTPNTSLEHL